MRYSPAFCEFPSRCPDRSDFLHLVNLIPHFCRRPSDMKFIPLSIAFSYFHAFFFFWHSFIYIHIEAQRPRSPSPSSPAAQQPSSPVAQQPSSPSAGGPRRASPPEQRREQARGWEDGGRGASRAEKVTPDANNITVLSHRHRALT